MYYYVCTIGGQGWTSAGLFFLLVTMLRKWAAMKGGCGLSFLSFSFGRVIDGELLFLAYAGRK